VGRKRGRRRCRVTFFTARASGATLKRAVAAAGVSETAGTTGSSSGCTPAEFNRIIKSELDQL
jgi:hypothetical protein